METEEKNEFRQTGFSLFKYFLTFTLIATGALMFARNFGYLSNDMFNIFVSWASLLIILGIYLICKKSYLWGGIIAAVGLFHTLDKLPQVPFGMNEMLWPTILVIGGIYLLFRPNRFSRRHNHFKGPFNKNIDNADFKTYSNESIDGYLKSENSFGFIKHVVFDETFKGGDIAVSFGGSVIDLRHTNIQEGECILNIDCKFSGIEIYIPSDWKVVNKCNVFLGGCDYKRYGAVDNNKVLTIKGNISFGGLDIKQ